jgi:hypothetical protein
MRHRCASLKTTSASSRLINTDKVFTDKVFATHRTAASVVHNDNHHPVMYLVGKVISVRLERLADRACARN